MTTLAFSQQQLGYLLSDAKDMTNVSVPWHAVI